MGEVYKAHDTRLDRTVAIKVLPEELSDNAELRERFEREARAISSLNHPHICTLYDVGREDGVDFLVMEYLEGETLAERLQRGALRLDEALRYAIQIADALDNAHRHGVVHRDLKPGNIMLTEAGAILLDFGLARLRRGYGGQAPLSSISTRVKPLTEKGAILGTFQYMAPEQLEGLEADTRTDIFAFGAVVYEMLTGKRAFEGESQASLIAAILEREPTPLSSLQPMTPPALERTIRKALAKEPDRRWQDAGDVGSELQWISEGGGLAVLREASHSRQIMPLAIAAILGVLVSGLAIWSMMRPGAPPVTRSTLLLPDEVTVLQRASSPVALSPDGTRVVYATAGEGLYLRALDDLEARPISGTEGGHTPFFSPDGQWIGFFTNEALKKVAVSGGAPLTLSTISTDSRGATWGPDGTIVFGTQGPLFEISAGGGTPRELTGIDEERHESAHRWPQFLPKGTGLVFTIRTRDGWGIAALSRDTQEVYRLDQLGQGVASGFVSSGHLVYAQSDGLLAVPFDPKALTLEGDPISVVENVQTAGIGVPHVALSENGSLVYVPGSPSQRRLVWAARDGASTLVSDGWGSIRHPRLSPDGSRVVVDAVVSSGSDLWVYDLERDTRTRLTVDGSYPEWYPDGTRITFRGGAGSRSDLFWQSSDGSGEAEPLLERGSSVYTGAWSPDGATLVFEEFKSGVRNLWLLPRDGDPSPLLETPFFEGAPRFSPDGRWLAYQSDASGRNEIYVQPFPGPGQRELLSSDGGTEPMWSPDGRELFYRQRNQMMVVPIEIEPTFRAGKAQPLFDAGRFPPGADFFTNYDVSPDGQRFLMIEGEGDSGPARLQLVLNWAEELKRRAPVED